MRQRQTTLPCPPHWLRVGGALVVLVCAEWTQKDRGHADAEGKERWAHRTVAGLQRSDIAVEGRSKSARNTAWFDGAGA